MIEAAGRRSGWVFLIVSAAVLAGCSGTKDAKQEDPNLVPTEYRKDVVNLVSTLVADPTNIREAAITDPFQVPVGGGGTRYAICVKFNPRNANKDYIGIVERVGYFYGGKLVQFVKAEAGDCKNAAYKPFPELEKICLATDKKCD